MKQKVTLVGMGKKLNIKFGKKEFMSIDLVDLLSSALKLSKSKVKKTFEEGGVDVELIVDEIK